MRVRSEHQASRDKGLLGLLKEKRGKGASEDIARALYPAKAAAGLCARLAQCSGR